MSDFTAKGARTSAVIFVLVKKYSLHQKENHEGISLRCINIQKKNKKFKGRKREGLDTYVKLLLCRNNLLVFEFPPIVPG